MILCAKCNTSNANKNFFCGNCGRRLRPVPADFEQNVISILNKRRRRLAALWCFALGVLGFFGYPVLKDAVHGELQEMSRTILKQANAQVGEMVAAEVPKLIAAEVPKAVTRVADTVRARVAANLEQTYQVNQREIDAIYKHGREKALTYVQDQ